MYTITFPDSERRIVDWAKANGVTTLPVPFSNKSTMSLTKEKKQKFFRDFAGSENTLVNSKVDLGGQNVR